jgi:acyl phosphate:glycerol-3-phosphate acyltransferase
MTNVKHWALGRRNELLMCPTEDPYCTRSGHAFEIHGDCVSALEVILPALAAACSYLVGSVPSAVIAARLAGRPDPRTVGTRNAGSTNVALTVGPVAGIAVLVADLLKGAVCGLAGLILGGPLLGDLCGLAAIVGQVFPVFAGFRGGKGAATTLGGYIGVAPALAVIGLISWGLALLLIRRAVLSTVTAIVALAVVTVAIQEHSVFGIGAGVLTLIAHRDDLAAWRRGEMPTIRAALRDNRRE